MTLPPWIVWPVCLSAGAFVAVILTSLYRIVFTEIDFPFPQGWDSRG